MASLQAMDRCAGAWRESERLRSRAGSLFFSNLSSSDVGNLIRVLSAYCSLRGACCPNSHAQTLLCMGDPKSRSITTDRYRPYFRNKKSSHRVLKKGCCVRRNQASVPHDFCKCSRDVQKLTGAYSNVVEIRQQECSGVKIAVRVLGSEDEKPQSGLAHAVQFLV